MKIERSHQFTARSEQAIALLDCMVYLGLFVLIFGLAVAAFFETNDNSKRLSQNAADIVRTMQVGERWRSDIRQASRIQIKSDRESICSIEQPSGEIRYIFKDGMVYRQALSGAVTNPVLVLASVKTSLMEPDRRAQVTPWRWEVELSGSQKAARVPPLFTFTAVPKKKVAL